MNQDNFDKSLIFSDSTVTLNSLEMNDGSELRLRHLSSKGKENEKVILDQLKPSEQIKRKTSLQEKVNYNYIDIQNDKWEIEIIIMIIIGMAERWSGGSVIYFIEELGRNVNFNL